MHFNLFWAGYALICMLLRWILWLMGSQGTDKGLRVCMMWLHRTNKILFISCIIKWPYFYFWYLNLDEKGEPILFYLLLPLLKIATLKQKTKKLCVHVYSIKIHIFFPHGGQLWAKPRPPWASPAEWLLSAPLKAAPKALRLGPAQQLQGARRRQVPPGASQFPQPRAGSLLGSLSEARMETQLWSPVSRGTLAGAAKTALTSTPMTRAPPSGASLLWKDWTWICVRMKGRVRSPFLK